MDRETRLIKFEWTCKTHPGQTGRKIAMIELLIDTCDEALIQQGKKPLSQMIMEAQQARLNTYLKEFEKSSKKERFMQRQRSRGVPGF